MLLASLLGNVSSRMMGPCLIVLTTSRRVLAQVELDFNSVERIVEYLGVPQEAPAVVREKRPPAAWPSSSGELVVEDLVVKYAPHLPAVLKKLSFYVKPSEKIGIVRFPRRSINRGSDRCVFRSGGLGRGSRRWRCRC